MISVNRLKLIQLFDLEFANLCRLWLLSHMLVDHRESEGFLIWCSFCHVIIYSNILDLWRLWCGLLFGRLLLLKDKCTKLFYLCCFIFWADTKFEIDFIILILIFVTGHPWLTIRNKELTLWLLSISHCTTGLDVDGSNHYLTGISWFIYENLSFSFPQQALHILSMHFLISSKILMSSGYWFFESKWFDSLG